MQDNYDDIKHLSRPQYDDYPPMSISDRAAQFSPFAALVGYDDEVAETARLTDSRKELTEDDAAVLSAKLNRLLDVLDERPEVKVTYFIPDTRKAGGRYADKTGTVRTYDGFAKTLVFTDGTKIAIRDIIMLEIYDE